MESTNSTTSPATPEELVIITKYLGENAVLIDEHFKTTAVMKESQA